MHLLSHLVTEANEAARRTHDAAPPNSPGLDQASYASTQREIAGLLGALFRNTYLVGSRETSEPTDASYEAAADDVAVAFVNEAIMRVEAAMYLKQRSNQPFTEGDLPYPSFMFEELYWRTREGLQIDLQLTSTRRFLDTLVREQLVSVQRSYLRIR